MPYVPPEEKERIKREVSIERLVEARGIKLRRVGRSLMGLCPFHDDHNPSLSIDPVKNERHSEGGTSRRLMVKHSSRPSTRLEAAEGYF